MLPSTIPTVKSPVFFVCIESVPVMSFSEKLPLRHLWHLPNNTPIFLLSSCQTVSTVAVSHFKFHSAHASCIGIGYSTRDKCSRSNFQFKSTHLFRLNEINRENNVFRVLSFVGGNIINIICELGCGANQDCI